MTTEKSFTLKSSFGMSVLMKITQKALEAKYPEKKITIENDDEIIKFTEITLEELKLFLEGEELPDDEETQDEENQGLLDKMGIKLQS